MSGGYSNGVWESRMLLVELQTCPKHDVVQSPFYRTPYKLAIVEHLESKEQLDDLLSMDSLEVTSHLGLLDVIHGEEGCQ